MPGNTNTMSNALADALLGNYRTYGESNDDPVGFFRYSLFDSYAQDKGKVSRKLSLTRRSQTRRFGRAALASAVWD